MLRKFSFCHNWCIESARHLVTTKMKNEDYHSVTANDYKLSDKCTDAHRHIPACLTCTPLWLVCCWICRPDGGQTPHAALPHASSNHCRKCFSSFLFTVSSNKWHCTGLAIIKLTTYFNNLHQNNNTLQERKHHNKQQKLMTVHSFAVYITTNNNNCNWLRHRYLKLSAKLTVFCWCSNDNSSHARRFF